MRGNLHPVISVAPVPDPHWRLKVLGKPLRIIERSRLDVKEQLKLWLLDHDVNYIAGHLESHIELLGSICIS